ncbi:hypothetical protein Dsin_032652 [Dipteronia sinensis]|uniref:Uncharacterized protein n=1 Tax=Dipteronia sinensis TaxID=43782 RepID=A0AAE0DKR5_9ROSI|nr:hypothetical protein Dsin_032652 [Dipteronia sinensis]
MRHTQILEASPQNPTGKTVDQDASNIEVDVVIGCLEARNRWTMAQKARSDALHSYVDMVIGAVESHAIESEPKAQFILQILQIILPKLDTFITEEAPEASELARATESLLIVLAQKSSTQTQSRVLKVITERLFQVFRICLEGIPLAGTSLELRTLLYSICSQYLARLMTLDQNEPDQYRKACSSSMDCVRSSSQRLIEIIADDAEDGTDICRLHALNLLSLLTALGRSQKSNHILDNLVKANVIEIMLEPIRNLTADFVSTSVKQRSQLLITTQARAALLLQISLSRSGAIALLDAGLIQALRDSNIFRADPDLGLGPELDTKPPSTLSTFAPASVASSSNTALFNYFSLLASILRLLLSTFISRGPENEIISNIVRNFLSEYRANMVGVFKKAAGVNGVLESKALRDAVGECVRCYTGLVVGCGFVEVEDDGVLADLGRPNGGFT